MHRFRRSTLACLLTLAALAGCTTSTPTGHTPANESPAAGEEGGACLTDGTCNQGLECLDDICTINTNGQDNTNDNQQQEPEKQVTLMIFHNNSGPMCLEALDWLEDQKENFPGLDVQEFLTTVPEERDLMHEMEDDYETSQGVSTSFQYLPIIFIVEEHQAFSGFNQEIADTIEGILLAPSVSAP